MLTEEDIPFELEALKLIARNARGSMRDALSLTDQAVSFSEANLTVKQLAEMLGTVDAGKLAPLLRALVNLDSPQVLILCEELASGAVDYQDVLATLLGIFHKLAVFQAVGTAASDDMQLIKELAEQVKPEVVQLYYQITLLGSRDLHLAPDPRVGFEMTMLRLLAFQPHGPGDERLIISQNQQPEPDQGKTQGKSTEKSGTPDATESSTSAGTRSSSVPVSVPADRGAPVVEVKIAVHEPTVVPVTSIGKMPWYDLVGALKLEGVTRMLAEHSWLESADSSVWRLRIDKSHETLVNETQIGKLQIAASALLGGEISIRVEIGKLDSETPGCSQETSV